MKRRRRPIVLAYAPLVARDVITMRAAKADRLEPSRTNWNDPIVITVTAADKAAAVTKADTMLGDAGRGWCWKFNVDKINEVKPT